MRVRYRLGAVCLSATMFTNAVESVATEQTPLPGWLVQEREDARQRGPEALLDVACALYARSGMHGSAHAFGLMREAAEAGSDTAALYLSTYLRLGVGTKKDEDAADKIIVTLISKIRDKRSRDFPSTSDAAKEVYAGRCGPSDLVTSRQLSRADTLCDTIEEPKPLWCR